ncbi:MAG: asparaginase [Ruminococcus sp.]
MKILTVFTGGTIGSTKSEGVISPDSENSYKLIEMYSKKDKKVEFTAVQPLNILSENMNGKFLTRLYKCISSYDLSEFDGVIVAHGTDTLQYTAAYLSYAFGLCKTPIVLVSANFPLEDERSNGFHNFCGAVELIRSRKGRGVFVSYANCEYFADIHRGAKVLQHTAYSDELYSIHDNIFGEIHGKEFVKNNFYSEQQDEISLADCTELEETLDVLYVKPYVGMTYPQIRQGTKAVLLEGYHSGTLNTDSNELTKFCAEAEKCGVPVYLTGAEQGFFYESKLMFEKLKIEVLPPASPIAMYMKLWMLKKDRLDDVFMSCGGDF